MAQVLPNGSRLGGYEIVEMVGKGGMGEVYRARQLSMDRPVALKVLAPRLAQQDPQFAKRFEDEAKAAGKLNHPNIIAVHDVGTAPPPPGVSVPGALIHYFSMEFVEGETLKDLLEREGALDPQVIAVVMAGMCEALGYAQAHGIVHRDIKPDNIMRTADGRVKLADLGLALHVETQEQVIDAQPGAPRPAVMGTPLYMSPEQARALPLDHRSDLYALGATLFQCVTGRLPFEGRNGGEVMARVLDQPPPSARAVNPAVPPALDLLIQRLMAKDADDRPADAAQLITELDAATADPERVTVTPAPRRRRPAPADAPPRVSPWLIVTLVALLLALALAGMLYLLLKPS